MDLCSDTIHLRRCYFCEEHTQKNAHAIVNTFSSDLELHTLRYRNEKREKKKTRRNRLQFETCSVAAIYKIHMDEANRLARSCGVNIHTSDGIVNSCFNFMH